VSLFPLLVRKFKNENMGTCFANSELLSLDSFLFYLEIEEKGVSSTFGISGRIRVDSELERRFES
jgi:hypothetical protein